MAIKVLKSDPAVSYVDYSRVVSAVMQSRELAFSVPAQLVKFAAELKAAAAPVLESGKVALGELLAVLKSRSLFEVLRHFKFSLSSALKAVTAAAKLVPRGLRTMMQALSDTKVVEALRSGALTVDSFLEKHPVARQLAGIALAGFLLWMWLNMSFTGDADFDLDLSVIGDALRGDYSFKDLLGTPEGLTSLVLLVTGMTAGISFPWLAGSAANLVLALVFTIAKRLHKTGFVQALKSLVDLSPGSRVLQG